MLIYHVLKIISLLLWIKRVSSNSHLAYFSSIFVFFFSVIIFDITHIISNQMISFDQFVFASDDRRTRYIIQIAKRVRNNQFQMLKIFSVFSFSNINNRSRFFSKRFFQNIIDIVNNVNSRKRDKKIDFRMNVTFESQSFKIFYNFISFEFVVVRFRQEIRRFARLASRFFHFFNFYLKKKTMITISTIFFSYDHTQISSITNQIKNLNTFRIKIMTKKRNHVCSIKKVKKHTRKRSSNNAFEFEKLISKLDVTTKIWILIIWSFAKKTWYLKNMYCRNCMTNTTTTCVFFAMFINISKNVIANLSTINIDIVASTTKSHRTWWFLKQILTL